jgi:hypothetical protein
MNPVEVLVAVDAIGGQLGIVGDKLRTLLPADCPRPLKDAIREHKSALLNLVRSTFLIVRSGVINAIVFFVPDDATKESLVSAGAHPGSIYTKPELAVLVRQRVTAKELSLMDAAKRLFNGKVTNP